MKFSLFIMTYCRPEILKITINKLVEQTCPPSKILIIDNDPQKSALPIANELSHINIEYYSIGWNSGPAGAAKIGLEILSKQGYEWIGWIDDDNPPLFNDSFEVLLKIAKTVHNCGCVGAVGQRFNKSNGLMLRVPDVELESNTILDVDNIAGGMCKIVNAEVINKFHVLPDEKLFYGFEELDFDIRIKNIGYTLIADAGLYKRNRLYHNRMGFKIIRGQKKANDRLWREYYSTRNILFILARNKYYSAVFFTFLKSVVKIFYGFKFGLQYGLKNSKFITSALIHFIINKKGSFKI